MDHQARSDPRLGVFRSVLGLRVSPWWDNSVQLCTAVLPSKVNFRNLVHYPGKLQFLYFTRYMKDKKKIVQYLPNHSTYTTYIIGAAHKLQGEAYVL